MLTRESLTAPVCEALLVHVGETSPDDAAALRLARNVVRDTLPGNWTVRPLAPGARDFRVTRRGSKRPIPVAAAWGHVARLRRHRDVADAEPDFLLPGHAPTDAQVQALFTLEERAALVRVRRDKPRKCAQDDDWSVKFVKAHLAWKERPRPGGAAQGRGIRIGHPDTGYTDHPEILPRKAQGGRLRVNDGYDFQDNCKDPRDPLADGFADFPGHGTRTSSVIFSGIGAPPGGAVSGGDSECEPGHVVTGTAPQAELIPIRVAETVIQLTYGKLAQGVLHATGAGAHVISISLGGPFRSGTLERAVKHAREHGVIVLAAAGNVYPWVVYPAKLDQVVAVGGCTCESKRWSKSARGSAVDVSAPGEDVWRASTQRDKDTGKVSYDVCFGAGTSYAVATTAGLCALWLAHHGRDRLLSRYGDSGIGTVFKELLVNHAVDTPSGWKTRKDGAGIVNAVKLLRAPLPRTVVAGGMGAVTAGSRARRASALDPFTDLMPDAPRAGVRAALLDLLGTDEAGLLEALEEFGHELEFHVATNPAVRGRLAAHASRSRPRRGVMAPAMLEDSAVAPRLSAALRRRLAG